LINKLNKGPGKILDVGCGTGAFLETCKYRGWNVVGMEPDTDARSRAIHRLSVQIVPELKAIPTDNKFDIITLWHVLEHIPDLNNTLPVLKSLLTNKGTLIIAVPNSDSYDAKYFKQFWAAYDVPRHLHHFTPSTIEPLFKKHGLKLVDKRPMIFDAIYIAMLSTRYQAGRTNYLKSLRVGLQSNNKARKDGQYSSITYLFTAE
jgi:SAM-dependent methyltransferase